MLSAGVQEYRNRIFRKLNIKYSEDFKILNFGCGQGHDNIDFAGQARYVVGIDIEPFEEWSELKEHNSTFIVGNGCFLPFKDNSFDIIFVKDVLHHINECDLALRQILRAVKTNGTVYILESNRYNPITYLHMVVAKDHQHFTKTYFKKLILALPAEYSVIFDSFEAHVMPIKNSLLHSLFNYIEDVMEKIPFINKFVSYNLAIIRKPDEVDAI